MTNLDKVDKGKRLRQWLMHPLGATATGAVVGVLIGFCPVLGDYKALFLFGTIWSDAHKSPMQLWAASLLASLAAGSILGLSAWAIVRFVTRSRLPPITRDLIAFVAAPISLLVALVVPMIGVGEWDDYLARVQLSDSTLVREFQENRSSFESMEQRIQKDPGLRHVHANIAAAPSEDTESKSYYSLLQKLNIIYSDTGDAENDFCVRDTGWTDGPSDARGYCYRTTPPANLRERLDGVDRLRAQNPSTDFFAYRHVEGNWYLYYHYRSDQ